MILVPESLDSHSRLSCGCLRQKVVEEGLRGKPGWLQGSLSSLFPSLPLGDGSRQREQRVKRHEADGACGLLRNPWCEPGRDEGRRGVRPHRVLEARQKLLDSALCFAFLIFWPHHKACRILVP